MKNLYIELGASLASSKPVRNIIKPYSLEVVEEFRKEYKNTDVFISAFRYDSQEIRKAKQQGPLYFDLDGEYAKDDLIALIDFLTKVKCPSDSLKVFFSGNKGFHLEIPFDVLGIEATSQLNKVYEVIAKEIKATIHSPSLDTGIYDAVRLWRLPNSINSKSGLYKIPLSLDETNLPLENIKELAKNPRNDFNYPQWIIWDGFDSVFRKAKKRITSSSYKAGVFEPVGEGQRNDATFRRAIRLKAEGKTFGEAVEICSQIKDTPPLSVTEIQRTVASAYQEKYTVTPIKTKSKSNENEITTSFFVTSDGLICEEVYDINLGEPQFAVYSGSTVEYRTSIENNGLIIKPIHDDVIIKSIVKLPSKATNYTNETELLKEIKKLIHDYVDVSEDWEEWTAYYVLLSWVYDKLPVCPYLCALGPSSSGKTRLIKSIGEICYKPFTTSGSATASPIFRILDKYRGTLIVNEFDHIGDFNSEIITMFNNGFETGFPVIRTEGDDRKQVKIFEVYGPKLFSSRRRKSDWAFESRLITIPMTETKRKDIPPFLLNDFHTRALEIRNKLLMFRFKHYSETTQIKTDLFPNVKGRLKQTLLSITSVIHDDVFLEKAKEFAKQLENTLKTIKEFDLDFFTYQVLLEYWEEGNRIPQIKEVAEKVRQLADYEKLSSKAIGNIVRDELGFETKRGGSSGNYVILLSSERLNALKERYEIIEQNDEDVSNESSETSASSVSNGHNTEVTEHTELVNKVNTLPLKVLNNDYEEPTF